MNDMNKDRLLTCVYCGEAYPPGSPTHGSKVLTDHIEGCTEHPLYHARQQIAKLRASLVGLIGAESPEELKQMELVLRSTTAPGEDKKAAIDAIHVLLETVQ